LRKGPFEGPATVKPPALPVDTYSMVEAAGVERFFDYLNSITYVFSIAYKSAKMPKMPLSWYSFGTVFG
jgi:hypothetical protein